MEFPYTEDQEHAEALVRLCQERIATSVQGRDREARWDAGLFRAALRAMPAHHESPQTLARALQTLGRHGLDGGLAMTLWTQQIGVLQPLMRFGTEAQRRRLEPRLASGELQGSVAFQEDHTPGDPLGLQTRAERAGDRWILHGQKRWTLGGASANLWLVSAITDPSRGRQGVSTFLVERGAPGLTVDPPLPSSGLRTTSFASLALDRCSVPAENMLGPEGSFVTHMDPLYRRWERATVYCAWQGLLEGLLGRGVELLQSRTRWGKAAAHSQQHRAALADVKIRVELARRMQQRSVARVGGEGGDLDIAVSALFLAETVRGVTGSAAATLGALEGPGGLVDRLHRDAAAMGLVVEEETTLRPVIAGAMLGVR
ncbi:MAG: acyl-CoA dehydrogenase family protein [Polyangiaceae bacterium]|jgi:alkylation response protein AidB-like acyl-CoA dehydrogenase|nr:acyl-CoA dehydrogenase family protein [Polyangiaceae bacterium]